MNKEYYSYKVDDNLYNNDDVNIIPIHNIGISLEICDAVKFSDKNIDKDEILGSFPTDPYIRDINYPLKRMDSIMDALNNNIPLPPIIISKNDNISYYNILNGRHRMTGSIIKQYNKIPVIIY